MKSDERRKLENKLMVMGLAKLDDPNLIQQMAIMISDHDFYRDMLGACGPEQRYVMYESLKPHLSFKPLPLEHYMDQIREKAGNIASRETPIVVGEKLYQEVPVQESDGVIVKLTCHRCKKVQEFFGATVVEAAMAGRAEGWKRFINTETCPTCRTRSFHNEAEEASNVVN